MSIEVKQSTFPKNIFLGKKNLFYVSKSSFLVPNHLVNLPFRQRTENIQFNDLNLMLN